MRTVNEMDIVKEENEDIPAILDEIGDTIMTVSEEETKDAVVSVMQKIEKANEFVAANESSKEYKYSYLGEADPYDCESSEDTMTVAQMKGYNGSPIEENICAYLASEYFKERTVVDEKEKEKLLPKIISAFEELMIYGPSASRYQADKVYAWVNKKVDEMWDFGDENIRKALVKPVLATTKKERTNWFLVEMDFVESPEDVTLISIAHKYNLDYGEVKKMSYRRHWHAKRKLNIELGLNSAVNLFNLTDILAKRKVDEVISSTALQVVSQINKTITKAAETGHALTPMQMKDLATATKTIQDTLYNQIGVAEQRQVKVHKRKLVSEVAADNVADMHEVMEGLRKLGLSKGK